MSEREVSAAKMLRAGLYRVEVDGTSYTIEQRWDIDGKWWVTEDEEFFDPNRGVFRTLREALESLQTN
ncbi:hypothetical protein SEA_ARGIE_78 [Mycobacterium phage Argie]|nr:hypothetical protein SEA_ARGIE_78 [Mycobacterium phage Argie]